MPCHLLDSIPTDKQPRRALKWKGCVTGTVQIPNIQLEWELAVSDKNKCKDQRFKTSKFHATIGEKKNHPQEKSLSFTLSTHCLQERKETWIHIIILYLIKPVPGLHIHSLPDHYSSRIKPKHPLVWQLRHSFWELKAPLKNRFWTQISTCWVGTQTTSTSLKKCNITSFSCQKTSEQH